MSAAGRGLAVTVVGAGIGGLTVAWALAREGAAVTVVEQGPIPNPRSSSFDEHRIIRHAYGPFAGYGRMMPAAFAAWDRLFADMGARHFRETGSVFALRGSDAWARDSAAVMGETGAVIRELPLDRLADVAPMVRPEGVTAAFETEGDGILFNTRILGGLVGLLARLGVRFRAEERVVSLDAARAAVVTDRGTLGADRLVVATGAWTPKLLPERAGDLVPSRQAVLYLAPPADLAPAWDRAPVLVDFNGEEGTYTVPPRDGTRLKIGDHVFSLTGDADDDRIHAAAEVDRLRQVAAGATLRFDDYTVLETKVCYYTVRTGERFLAEPLGDRTTVLSACSGHGFKFAPLVGRLVADAVTGRRSAEAVAALVAGDGNLLPS